MLGIQLPIARMRSQVALAMTGASSQAVANRWLCVMVLRAGLQSSAGGGDVNFASLVFLFRASAICELAHMAFGLASVRTARTAPKPIQLTHNPCGRRAACLLDA